MVRCPPIQPSAADGTVCREMGKYRAGRRRIRAGQRERRTSQRPAAGERRGKRLDLRAAVLRRTAPTRQKGATRSACSVASEARSTQGRGLVTMPSRLSTAEGVFICIMERQSFTCRSVGRADDQSHKVAHEVSSSERVNGEEQQQSGTRAEQSRGGAEKEWKLKCGCFPTTSGK